MGETAETKKFDLEGALKAASGDNGDGRRALEMVTKMYAYLTRDSDDGQRARAIRPQSYEMFDKQAEGGTEGASSAGTEFEKEDGPGDDFPLHP